MEKVFDYLSPAEAETLEKAARIFRALGDSERLRLLKMLKERELCVSDIAEITQDGLPSISQRLKILHLEGLVKRRRQGKHIYYALADHHINELIFNALAHAEHSQE